MTKNVADLQQNKGSEAGKSREIPASYSENWVSKLDGRTSLARIIQDRLTTLQNDLGGPDQLSYQQRSLCRRAIWMEAVIEQQEIALSKGEEIDQGKLTQATNTLIGLFRHLGLERKARDVPSLSEYIESKRREKEGGSE